MKFLTLRAWPLLGLLPIAIGGCHLSLQLPSAEDQAKFYVNAIAQGQKAYYSANGEFASSLEQLKLDFKLDSPDYRLTATSHGEPTHSVLIEAAAKDDTLHSYAGLVYVKADPNNQVDVIVNACQTEQPDRQPPTLTTAPELITPLDCPEGSIPVQ